MINFLSKNVITNVCLALACVAKNTHLNVIIFYYIEFPIYKTNYSLKQPPSM